MAVPEVLRGGHMSTLYRARVVRIDDSGVYVEVPELGEGGEFGPLEMLSIPLSVADPVLVGSVNDITEDMALLGKLVVDVQVAPSIPPFPPANSSYILYYENETARTAASLTLTSGLATWLDDEQRLDIYTDEPTAGWISFYGAKGGKLAYPFGMTIGLGQPNPDGSFDVNATGSTQGLLVARVLFDPAYRYRVNASGTTQWGDGTAAQDTTLQRANANGLQITPGLGVNVAPDANSRLKIENTTAARKGVNIVSTSSTQSAAHVDVESHASAGASPAFSARLTGESVPRLVVASNGLFQWSDGASAADTTLARGGIGWLTTPGGLDVGDFLDAGSIDCAGDAYLRDKLLVGPTDSDMGRGLWAVAQSSSDSSATSGTTETVMLTTSVVTFYANRAYEIRYSQRFAQGIANASSPFIFFRKTNAAGQQLCDMGRENFLASVSTYHFSGSAVFTVGGSDVSAAICQTITPSVATNIVQKGTASHPRMFQIWDIGTAAMFGGATPLV